MRSSMSTHYRTLCGRISWWCQPSWKRSSRRCEYSKQNSRTVRTSVLLLLLLLCHVIAHISSRLAFNHQSQRDDNDSRELNTDNTGTGSLVIPMYTAKAATGQDATNQTPTIKKKSAPKKKTTKKTTKKKMEDVSEADPLAWEQNVAWIATADDNAAAMTTGLQWQWMMMTYRCCT
ncbi:hypothetical protein QTG54_011752 [Skeletonema marinoi]|uniref:Uncharacterized protein n=1 Tax=Skeletonema marinoi TaxID=267567 RepID=A0AAD8Y0Q3_9STRA|nr:hypothetical protein QTG54_011752 [Skeletonema marinoi]